MKRLPSHSASVAIKAMSNAAKPPLEVPRHVKLREGDKPFWDAILSARARDEWTPADLVVGCQLARCMADIERESLALDGESMVVENARGTVVVNARVSVLEQLARREMALMRTLRMGGFVSGAPPRDEQTGAKMEREAGELRQELAEEELLAT